MYGGAGVAWTLQRFPSFVFHATIHKQARGPYHVSGKVVPYDLENLRQAVLARGGRGTRVEVRLSPHLRPAFLAALQDLERRGVDLILTP